MKVEQIGDWTLEDRLATDRPIVVMFVKSDGQNIRLLRSEFRHLAEEHQDAKFYEVDLLENPSLTDKYQIPDTPLVLVFVGGVEVARHAGTLIAITVDRVLGPCHPEGDDSRD